MYSSKGSHAKAPLGTPPQPLGDLREELQPLLPPGLSMAPPAALDVPPADSRPHQQREGEGQELKEEIAQLRRELHEKQHILDRVIADHINTRAQVEEKSRVLAEKDQLISRLEADEQRRRGLDWHPSPGEAHRVSASSSDSRDKDLRIRQLEEDKRRLEAAAEAYESTLAEERAGRLAAEGHLETAKQRGDTLGGQVATLLTKVGAGAGYVTGAEQSRRATADVDPKEGVRAEAKIRELQDLVEFFKRNSERNSKRVSELTRKFEESTGTGHF